MQLYDHRSVGQATWIVGSVVIQVNPEKHDLFNRVRLPNRGSQAGAQPGPEADTLRLWRREHHLKLSELY